MVTERAALAGRSTAVPGDRSGSEWACGQRSLPSLPARGRPRTHSLRLILDAIFYVVRTGCAWRYLHCNFPPWPTVFYHFRRFRLHSTWHLIYSALPRAERERVGRYLDPSAAVIDTYPPTTP